MTCFFRCPPYEIAAIQNQSNNQINQMDNNTQDQYIQKKLLYKFDKKLDAVQQEYFRQMFSSPENPRKLSNEEMIEEIAALQFINFKYRTALLSSYTDLAKNKEELQSQESNIQAAKEEIDELMNELEKAQIAMQNKRKFNEIGKEIKKYDKKEVFDSKLQDIQAELKELEDKHTKDTKNYENKERLLKTAISSLKCFLNDFENRKDGGENPEIFRSSHAMVAEPGEDDGQIQ